MEPNKNTINNKNQQTTANPLIAFCRLFIKDDGYSYETLVNF